MPFQIGQIVTAVNIKPLPGNTIAPPLAQGLKYPIRDIVLDKDGNQHIDVGLYSEFNFITSYETKEELPNGDKTHWCHPSRFEA